ncbi:MAG: hypothetical protein WBA63_04960 [Thermomicrobiales bacterium]
MDVSKLALGVLTFILLTVATLLIERALGGPIERVWARGSNLIRNRRKSLLILETSTISFGSRTFPYAIVDGIADSEFRPDSLILNIADSPLELPEPLQRRKAVIAQQMQHKAAIGERADEDGEIVYLKRFQVVRPPTKAESPELRLWLGRATWFDFLATNMSLDEPMVFGTDGQEIVETIRQHYLSDHRWGEPGAQPPQWFSNTLGIVVALITSDRQLILTRRSGSVGTRASVFNIPINGGVHPSFDRAAVQGHIDPFRSITREATEELGIPLTEDQIHIFALGVDTEYGMWNLLGFAESQLTAAEVQEHFQLRARDRHETRQLIVCPFDTPHDVVTFVLSHQEWSPGAIACLKCLLHSRFSSRSIDNAIRAASKAP